VEILKASVIGSLFQQLSVNMAGVSKYATLTGESFFVTIFWIDIDFVIANV